MHLNRISIIPRMTSNFRKPGLLKMLPYPVSLF